MHISQLESIACTLLWFVLGDFATCVKSQDCHDNKALSESHSETSARSRKSIQKQNHQQVRFQHAEIFCTESVSAPYSWIIQLILSVAMNSSAAAFTLRSQMLRTVDSCGDVQPHVIPGLKHFQFVHETANFYFDINRAVVFALHQVGAKFVHLWVFVCFLQQKRLSVSL